MLLSFTAIFFILGLIVGSFLNVVILRFNTQKSLGGRSGCMSCQSKLSWIELIPLFSFLGLKGRCRNCKTKISIQYPLVELTTGLIFACLFFKFQDLFFSSSLLFAGVYAYYALMFSILIIIAVYDLRHKIIPDSLSFIFGALAFLGLFFFPSFQFHMPSILEFSSGLLVAFPFAFFWVVSRGRWMGLGDAKLALGIGWLLGITTAFSGLVLAFWSGAIVGVTMIVLSKMNRKNSVGMKSEIPFAPFLVFGTILAFIAGINLFVF